MGLTSVLMGVMPTYAQIDNAQILASADYPARLNNLTPWTQRIMQTLAHFRRGGGSIVAQGGHRAGHGGHVAIARFEDALPDRLNGDKGQELADTLARMDWIANVQIMSVKNEATSIATQEKSMHTSQEGVFSTLLIIESLDAGSLERAIAHAGETGGMQPEDFGVYDLVFVSHAH